MNIPDNVLPYWKDFIKATGEEVKSRYYETFHFCDNEADANELFKLVVEGKKQATASLFWGYEAENEELPKVGNLSIVIDWDGEPKCVIETSNVNIYPFDEVNAEFAAKEGEGDLSLEYWQKVHWNSFGRYCKYLKKEPTFKMPVVCEQFKIVYK
jgi:uncharacterized protein YhfF